MGMFGFGDRAKPMGLQEFLQSYRFCFQYLPDRIFGNPTIFIEKYTANPEHMLAAHLHAYFATRVGHNPHPQFMPSCAVHKVELSNTMRALIIQYPTPPSVPIDFEPNMPLPAPFFSAIVYEEHDKKNASHYVLCQDPVGGTVLRSVTMDSNMNLGSGPPPVLTEFIGLLKSMCAETTKEQVGRNQGGGRDISSLSVRGDGDSRAPASEAALTKVPTVSEVVSSAGELLEKGYKGVAVQGMVSNWIVYESGHAYFTLKDADAQLAAVMFRAMDHVQSSISDGMSLMVKGKLTIYAARGQLHLIVDDIEHSRPDHGARLEGTAGDGARTVAGNIAAHEKVWAVSEIVSAAAALLESRYGNVIISGEVSNWKLYPSGHAYLTLKDEHGQLGTVLFHVGEKVHFHVTDGMSVEAEGRLTIYAARGQFQCVAAKLGLPCAGRARATASRGTSVGSVTQATSQHDRFKSELTHLVPDWEKINAEPGFFEYLTQVDAVTGKSFKDVAMDALNRLSAADLAWFFSDYMMNKGSGPSARTGPAMSGEALYRRGVAYRDGLGLPKDDGEATRWFRLAAAKGNEDARNIVLGIGGGGATPLNVE